MALLQVEFFSEVLGLASSMEVIIPQKLQSKTGMYARPLRKPYPVLYLLHGGSDNHLSWQRNSAIEKYAADRSIVVIMPAVQYSFYADQKYGLKYFTFLSQELPEIVKSFFPVSDKRKDTFAAGISMGGYGAFKLGIVCPERFAAVASLSGSLDQRSRLTGEANFGNQVMLDMAKHTFGSVGEYERSDNDLFYTLERRIAEGIDMPRMYQACGTEDHNYRMNGEFSAQFMGRTDLTCEIVEGRGHDWSFWDEYIQKVLHWLPIEAHEREIRE